MHGAGQPLDGALDHELGRHQQRRQRQGKAGIEIARLDAGGVGDRDLGLDFRAGQRPAKQRVAGLGQEFGGAGAVGGGGSLALPLPGRGTAEPPVPELDDVVRLEDAYGREGTSKA